MPEETALDPAVLDTLRQLNEPGQPDVLAEVLGLFVGDAGARMTAIEAAVAQRDAPTLRRAAHTLKGAAGSIGATALQAACLQLEEMGKQGDFSGTAAGIDRMQREYQRVKAAIDQLL